MSENKYKIKITSKNVPFSNNDTVICKNMSLIEAVNFSKTLNTSIEDSKIALIEYESSENETDLQSKSKVASDVKEHGLEDFAIFKNNMLILTPKSMTTEITDFKPNEIDYSGDAEDAINNAISEFNNIDKKVVVVSKSNEFDNLKFITYDVVHESVPFPIASKIYLAESAVTIMNAIRNGEAINSPKIMQALAENNVYSGEVLNHAEKLRELLKQNKAKTKSEVAEEAAIDSWVEIETLVKRMSNHTY